MVVSPANYVESASKWCSWIELDEIFQTICTFLYLAMFSKIFMMSSCL